MINEHWPFSPHAASNALGELLRRISLEIEKGGVCQVAGLAESVQAELESDFR